jgi:hypothetical protein
VGNNNYLLGTIARILDKPQILRDGLTQADADKIERLEINSPEAISKLGVFRNLRFLKLVNDFEAPLESKVKNIILPSLPNLHIFHMIETSGIETLDFSNIPHNNNLMVKLKNNRDLKEVRGAEYFKEFQSLDPFWKFEVLLDGSKQKVKQDFSNIAKSQAQNPDILKKLQEIEASEHIIEWRDGHIQLSFQDGFEVAKIADGIINEIITNEMNEIEKICAINTWIAENLVYDYKASNERDDWEAGRIHLTDEEWRENWKANSCCKAFSEGIVVCGAYAAAESYLFNRAGIESEVVYCGFRQQHEQSSRRLYVYPNDPKDMDLMDHGIVRFKYKGSWYYDDPTLDAGDPIKRKYFFKTHQQILRTYILQIYENRIGTPLTVPPECTEENLKRVIYNQKCKTKEVTEGLKLAEEFKKLAADSFRAGNYKVLTDPAGKFVGFEVKVNKEGFKYNGKYIRFEVNSSTYGNSIGEENITNVYVRSGPFTYPGKFGPGYEHLADFSYYGGIPSSIKYNLTDPTKPGLKEINLDYTGKVRILLYNVPSFKGAVRQYRCERDNTIADFLITSVRKAEIQLHDCNEINLFSKLRGEMAKGISQPGIDTRSGNLHHTGEFKQMCDKNYISL